MAEKENTEEVENIEVKEKQEKVLHSNEEYDELNDRYKRVLAEFENFKKRSQKERGWYFGKCKRNLCPENGSYCERIFREPCPEGS